MTLPPARRLSLLGLLVAALLLAGLPAALAPSYAGTSDATADRAVPDARAFSSRVIRFGQVGKARAGMTIAQAVATGELNKNVPNPPCGPIKLQPKKPYVYQYVVLTAQGHIAEIDVVKARPRTQYGLGVGSSNEQVWSDYRKALSKPVQAGYSQWARFVKTGTGANRRWIGFLFGQALVDDGPLRATDTVTLVGVSKGARPGLMLDGC